MVKGTAISNVCSGLLMIARVSRSPGIVTLLNFLIKV